ncbi:MAG: hypothetical protein K0R08_286 [Solimicrobium sp.]|jgi:uncharacterized protein YjbI with pentapeptide repeats|nr:hypothetical protein [Solimicrobium sp.]
MLSVSQSSGVAPSSSPNVDNINRRIEENRQQVEDLKATQTFQNILTLMRKAAVGDEQILNFLTGKVSLEKCLGKETWMINLLVHTYPGFDDHYVETESSHFLSESLVNTLSTIFKRGYFESSEKTNSKIRTLMKAIEKENSSGTLNLRDLNLSYLDLTGANLAGANCHSARFRNATMNMADCSGACFSWANLTEADAVNANFSNALLDTANLSGANFSNTNLTQADMNNVNCDATNFSQANLSGIKSSNLTILQLIKEQEVSGR